MSEDTQERDVAPDTAALKVIKKGDEPWIVRLNDLPLEMLLAPDGLKVEVVDYPPIGSMAKVSMVFAEGALDLDFDVDVDSATLIAAVEAATEGGQ